MFGSPPEGEIWSGDDAAVVAAPAGRMLFTIDTLIEEIDFDLAYAKPEDVGWKAVAVNVSDIAAMGGRPAHAVTALWLPSSTSLVAAEGISRGVAECCKAFSVSNVGGDVSTASQIGIAVAMTGGAHVEPVRRSGARPGDLLGVTGQLGGAAAGLAALQAGRGADFPDAVRRQLRPQPRADEGGALAGAGVTAMVDISDGLASDLGHLTEASGTGCDVDVHALPVDPSVGAVAEVVGRAVLDMAVIGGEDFELLFAVPPDRLDAVQDALSGTQTPVSIIGRFTDAETGIAGRSLKEWKERGWEHLRAR